MDQPETNRTRRIAKNTLLLYVRMIVLMLVTLYTSRLVLATLGVEDFGIYGIVSGVVVLFAFLNNAMSSATQRFISYALGEGDENELKRIFSASMTIHIGIVMVIVLLAETVGLWFLNAHLNIPSDKLVAANWIYQFAIISFSIKVLQVPYNATIIAYERMSFFAYAGIVEGILQLGAAVLLIYFFKQKLIMYGALMMIVSIVIFFVYRIYSLCRFKISKYHLFWEPVLYKRILSFSGWSILGGTAEVSANQGINIILNMFFGVTVNAAVSIANQVNAALNSFVINFQTAFRPQIVKSYASNDKAYMFKLMNQTARFSFFLLYVLAIPIILNMDYVLNLWLKDVPEYAVVFCQLILVYSLFEALSGPLWMGVQASGKIRNYQIVVSTIITMNLVLSYLLLRQGLQPQVVFCVKIGISAVCFLARLFFTVRLVKIDLVGFFKSVVLPIIYVVPLSLLPSIYIASNLLPQSISSIGLVFLITFTTILIFGVSRGEREVFKNFIFHKK